ncbi:MAG TPA: matrixin family metalloprotease [Solirubrobacterales bacterium]
MTRRAAIAAVLALVLGLSCPAGAVGAPFTAELDRAYVLAAEWWGTPPRCASVETQIVAADTLESWVGEPALGGATIPAAPGEPCRLWITRQLAAPREDVAACAVVLHEYGHLLGLEHDDDPASIMYPQLVRAPAVCFTWGLRELNRRDRFRPVDRARRAI